MLYLVNFSDFSIDSNTNVPQDGTRMYSGSYFMFYFQKLNSLPLYVKRSIVAICRGCRFGRRAPLLAVVHGAEATMIKLLALHKQLKESNSSLTCSKALLREGSPSSSNPQFVAPKNSHAAGLGCRSADMTVEVLFTKMSTPR